MRLVSVLNSGSVVIPRTEMLRVLVMDDEADTRIFLEDILQAAGYQVVLAGDGAEGMQRYNSEPTDLALIDLFMPNREGLETIREIRKRAPDFPIIAISGDSLAECLLQVARRIGANDVLQKPFSPEQLLASVKKCCQAVARKRHQCRKKSLGPAAN
jgi:CheY-like chemotaxis protein